MTVIQLVNVPQPVKLTIEQFELLDRSGAFDAYAKTELIDGAIYAMNSQYAAHALAKSELGLRLGLRLRELNSRLRMVSEGTVAMPPVSAPEPDLALAEIAPGTRTYIPLEAVALLVEVADSTAAFDLKDKAALYAEHAVPEYWVLEIPGARIHQLWAPSPQGYGESRIVEIGGRISSVTIPGLTVTTDGLI
ncbi:MAG TPA: Uma2 family endonuclease [Allosphingosinicella sp.]|nr:Uma2 family endonuclease [Allosphingosinicella sp.]HYC82625.1 Uma2 family endonuclease [Solirubrobacterales bacterium]